MSLWWTGPDAASANLAAPKAPPNSSQRVPRLMKTVANNRFVQIACGGGHCSCCAPVGGVGEEQLR